MAVIILGCALLVASATNAEARTLPRCGRGRIVLTASTFTLRCDMRPGQRLDELIPADDFAHALDVCAHHGGTAKPRISRLVRPWAGMAAGQPVIRCNNIDF